MGQHALSNSRGGQGITSVKETVFTNNFPCLSPSPSRLQQVDMGSDKSNGIWDMIHLVIVGVLGTAASGYLLSPFMGDEFGFNAARKAIDQVGKG